MTIVPTKSSGNLCTEQEALFRIPTVLILLCAFFLPLGPALEGVMHVNLSKTYAALASLLIIYWALFARRKFSSVPPAITLFLLYFLLHTFITYVLIFPERLTGEYIYEIYTLDGRILSELPWTAGFSRMMLFAGFTYVLATYLRNDWQFRGLAYSIGAGLLVTLLVGREDLQISGSSIRIAAGFYNPNYFGSVAATVCFLNLMALAKAGGSVKNKIISCCFVITGLTGCIVSGSRGSLFSLVVGLIVMLYYTPGFSRRVCNVTILVLIVVLAFVIMPADIRETVGMRFSREGLVRGSGAIRLETLSQYIAQMPRYFFTGVGYGRSREILIETVVLPRATHNQYLAVLVGHGIVGLLLFLLGLWQVWKRLRRRCGWFDSRRIDAIYCGLFAAWMFMHLFGTRSTSRPWWFSLGVIAAYGAMKRIGQSTAERRSNSKKAS